MQSQISKLLILLNACFWVAVSFGIWKYSAGFPQQVVSTLVVMGVMAVAANLFFWAARWLAPQKMPVLNNRWIQSFILFSTLIQLLLIFFFIR
jgi:hypothetical protein